MEVYPPQYAERAASVVRAVQRSSWGFYVPPPQGDCVLLARTPKGGAVGSAYYNLASSNVDHGIHVSRQH